MAVLRRQLPVECSEAEVAGTVGTVTKCDPTCVICCAGEAVALEVETVLELIDKS